MPYRCASTATVPLPFARRTKCAIRDRRVSVRQLARHGAITQVSSVARDAGDHLPASGRFRVNAVIALLLTTRRPLRDERPIGAAEQALGAHSKDGEISTGLRVLASRVPRPIWRSGTHSPGQAAQRLSAAITVVLVMSRKRPRSSSEIDDLFLGGR